MPALKQILLQFADDTGVYLKYEYLTLELFTNTLFHIENLMGLKVSYDKTLLYRVGSLAHTNMKICNVQKNYNGPMDQ